MSYLYVGLGLRGAIIAGLAPLLIFFSSVGSPYGFLLLLGGLVYGLAEVGFLKVVWTSGVSEGLSFFFMVYGGIVAGSQLVNRWLGQRTPAPATEERKP